MLPLVLLWPLLHTMHALCRLCMCICIFLQNYRILMDMGNSKNYLGICVLVILILLIMKSHVYRHTVRCKYVPHGDSTSECFYDSPVLVLAALVLMGQRSGFATVSHDSKMREPR